MNIGGFPSLFSKGVHICLGALGKGGPALCRGVTFNAEKLFSLGTDGDGTFCSGGVRQGGMGCGQGCGVSLVTLGVSLEFRLCFPLFTATW